MEIEKRNSPKKLIICPYFTEFYFPNAKFEATEAEKSQKDLQSFASKNYVTSLAIAASSFQNG